MARLRGRDAKKERFWRRAVGGQRRSGLTVRAWCARHGVRETSFYWWRRELVRREAEQPSLARRDAASPLVSFAPVQVTAESDGARDGSSRIEIIFPDACRVSVVGPVDRRVLADVLAVLHSGDGDAALGMQLAVDAEAAAC